MNIFEIKVLAGDFYPVLGFSYNSFNGERFHLATDEHKWKGEKIPATELAELSIASEESVKKMGGAIGLGLAGGVLFGPLGLIAGALAGGRKKEVTFIARFRDGRKLLGVCEQKTFAKMQAVVF